MSKEVIWIFDILSFVWSAEDAIILNIWWLAHICVPCFQIPYFIPKRPNSCMHALIAEFLCTNLWANFAFFLVAAINSSWFSQLLFADDTALVADSEEKLCRLVSEFGRVCERRKLRVKV